MVVGGSTCHSETSEEGRTPRRPRRPAGRGRHRTASLGASCVWLLVLAASLLSACGGTQVPATFQPNGTPDAGVVADVPSLPSASPTAEPERRNLLPNPGFEAGSAGPERWKPITVGFTSPLWDGRESHSGRRSLGLPSPTLPSDPPEEFRIGWEVAAPLLYNPAYEHQIEVWCKWDSPPSSHDQARVSISGLDELGNAVRHDSGTPLECGVGEWERATFIYPRPPKVIEPPRQIVVRLLRTAIGGPPSRADLWFDDVAMVRIR